MLRNADRSKRVLSGLFLLSKSSFIEDDASTNTNVFPAMGVKLFAMAVCTACFNAVLYEKIISLVATSSGLMRCLTIFLTFLFRLFLLSVTKYFGI